jgi:hypothetical protein
MGNVVRERPVPSPAAPPAIILVEGSLLRHRIVLASAAENGQLFSALPIARLAAQRGANEPAPSQASASANGPAAVIDSHRSLLSPSASPSTLREAADLWPGEFMEAGQQVGAALGLAVGIVGAIRCHDCGPLVFLFIWLGPIGGAMIGTMVGAGAWAAVQVVRLAPRDSTKPDTLRIARPDTARTGGRR